MNPLWLAPADSADDKNRYFRAVRVIDGEQPARIDIAAESYYLLHVNGKVIGRGPARGARRHNYFDTYELSEYLSPEKNVIAILVYCMNIPTFTAAPSRPAFWVRFDSLPTSAEDWRVAIAADWREDAPLYTQQTGFAEWRDLRAEPIGWTLGKGTENWPAATVVPADHPIYAKELLPRDIPRLRETVLSPTSVRREAAVPRLDHLDAANFPETLNDESHLPLPPERARDFDAWLIGDTPRATLLPGTDGEGAVLIFVFDAEIIGRFALEIDGVAGAVVDIRYGEKLENGRIMARLSASHAYNFSDRYILRDGRQVIGDTIVERGFRIVQAVFRDFDKPLTLRSVQAVKATYPYVHRGSFICDNFLLNRVWDVCGETLSCCSTDIFTDCPWRERAFWVNDLIVENRTSLEFFGASAIHRRAFRMVFSDARDNSLIAGVCPCDAVYDRLLFPATNLFMPLMLRDYLLRSGDLELVRELLPGVFRIFEAFEAWFDTDRLIVPPKNIWNFFDWSFGMTGVSLDGKNTAALNCLYPMAIDAALELAALVGTPVDAAKYRARANQTAEATHRRFFKKSQKRLADWLEPNGEPSEHSSQLAHALALLSGRVPPERRADYEAALNDKRILEPELYLSYFVFQATRLSGQEAMALERIEKYWGSIVATGSPTIWEAGVHGRGETAFGGNGSLCHGFAAAPIDFFQTVILGVEPLKPGFAEFRLAPKPCGLKFAQGRVPTPNGDIHVRWEANGNDLALTLDVPPSATAVSDDKRRFETGQHVLTLPGERRVSGNDKSKT